MSKSPISVLMEYCAANGTQPVFILKLEEKFSFQYEVTATIKGLRVKGVGRATSKKEAKRLSASNFLENLTDLNNRSTNKKDVPVSIQDTVTDNCNIVNNDINNQNLILEFNEISALPIQNLIDECRKRCLPSPTFNLIGTSGPPHARMFRSVCKIGNEEQIASAGSKKKANSLVASLMLQKVMSATFNEREHETAKKEAYECTPDLSKSFENLSLSSKSFPKETKCIQEDLSTIAVSINLQILNDLCKKLLLPAPSFELCTNRDKHAEEIVVDCSVGLHKRTGRSKFLFHAKEIATISMLHYLKDFEKNKIENSQISINDHVIPFEIKRSINKEVKTDEDIEKFGYPFDYKNKKMCEEAQKVLLDDKLNDESKVKLLLETINLSYTMEKITAIDKKYMYCITSTDFDKTFCMIEYSLPELYKQIITFFLTLLF